MTSFQGIYSSTLDEFLAVGSYYPNNAKAELYNFGTGSWKTVSDYPFSSKSVYSYDMLYIPDTSSYLVIGGSDGNGLSQIAKFFNGNWIDAGQLNLPRTVSFLLFVYFFFLIIYIT